MNEKWNERLKESREKKNITLKELESISKLDISQQSLIKYEKGEVYPRINILEKMCKIYGTTINYILYGDNKLQQSEDRSGSLITIFMLLFSRKIEFNQNSNSLDIKDKKLSLQIRCLNDFSKNSDFSSFDDLNHLIEGINKLVSEK